MPKLYTAYGESYTADMWADILDVRPSTIYKHACDSEYGTAFLEQWIAGRLDTYRENLLRDEYRNISVAELVDIDCIYDVVWTVGECTDDIANLERLLARESAAVKMRDEDRLLIRNTIEYLSMLRERLRSYLDAYHEKKKRAIR